MEKCFFLLPGKQFHVIQTQTHSRWTQAFSYSGSIYPGEPALSIQQIPFESKGATGSLTEHLKLARPTFHRDAPYMPWGAIRVICISHPSKIKHSQLGAQFPCADST